MEKISKGALMASILTMLDELGSAPSGVMYQASMAHTDIEDYSSVISLLKQLDAVTEKGHEITITERGRSIAKDFERLLQADRRVRNV
jgi:predicted transcriptional regulator